MSIDCDNIIRRLAPSKAIRSGGGNPFDSVKYHLAQLIMRRHEFGSVDSLIDFCSKPENLQAWLPSDEDRSVFSADLTSSLRRAFPSTPRM